MDDIDGNVSLPTDTLKESEQATATHPYASLTPDTVIDAIESTGRFSDARILALNSYENRVIKLALRINNRLLPNFIGLIAGQMNKF